MARVINYLGNEKIYDKESVDNLHKELTEKLETEAATRQEEDDKLQGEIDAINDPETGIFATVMKQFTPLDGTEIVDAVNMVTEGGIIIEPSETEPSETIKEEAE